MFVPHHSCPSEAASKYVRACPQMAQHQDGPRPPEADESQRHGVPGRSAEPVANSHDRACAPWFPAHACTHAGDDNTLEATHVHTRMTIQATRTRSRLAEHDGFSCPHERMVSRVDAGAHLRSHARGVGDPGTPHAGNPGCANTAGLPCGHARKCKHRPAHQSPCPTPALEKTFGGYRSF